MMNFARHFVAILGVLVVALSLSRTAHADQAAVFPDIKRLVDSGVLRVAILDHDLPPLIITDEQKGLTGSEPDLARDIAKKLGVDIEFVRTAKTFDDVVRVVARNEADIAVSYLTGGVQRAMYVAFTQAYIHQTGSYFYNRARFAKLKRDYDIDDLTAINGLQVDAGLVIGVVGGSVYQSQLKGELPENLIRTYESLDQIMTAVRENEIFAGISGRLQTKYYLREHSDLAIYIAIDSDLHLPSDIRIAVRPDAPNLTNWINLYLSNYVGVLDHEQIIQRYAKHQ